MTEDVSLAEGEKGKRALITGVTGQDGSYLAELLLDKGDRHEKGVKLFLHYGDLTDSNSITQIIFKVQPHEIYNLGAMSHVKASFELSQYTAETCGLGFLHLLNAVRVCGLEKWCRIYQASTSELFGNAHEFPQSELTAFRPRSPYAIAKQFAFWTAVNYREAYGMFISNGILFNHASPRRGRTFALSKIAHAACDIKKGGNKHCLYLGNLEAERDWGHARDYVRGMWMIMQHEKCDDFVLASGTCVSIRCIAEKVFALLGMRIKWKGKRGTVNEVGVDEKDESKVYIRIDPTYFRPTEVDKLVGDYSKAKRILGWEPEVTLDELINEIVEYFMKQ